MTKTPAELFINFVDSLFELTPSEGCETPLEETFRTGKANADVFFDEVNDTINADDDNKLDSVTALRQAVTVSYTPRVEYVDDAKYIGLAKDYVVCDLEEASIDAENDLVKEEALKYKGNAGQCTRTSVDDEWDQIYEFLAFRHRPRRPS
ncbi:MAG: hypothetical protein M1812_007087 [Candelaria pacifica]|nr:MAG: hypothetical protein M1812_007087 [Candelaria pacifica]